MIYLTNTIMHIDTSKSLFYVVLALLKRVGVHQRGLRQKHFRKKIKRFKYTQINQSNGVKAKT
jgi:hypothetical protein